MGFSCGSAVKESAYNVGDLGSFLGLGRSSGEGKGYPLQYSDLENSMEESMGSQRVDTTMQLSLSALQVYSEAVKSEEAYQNFLANFNQVE